MISSKISASNAILIQYYLNKEFVSKYPEESLDVESTTMKSSVSLVIIIGICKMVFVLKSLKNFK